MWRGWFGEVNDIKGLRISWAHAPKEVKIVGSADRQNDRVLIDWRQTPSRQETFTETLDFANAESVEEIKIYMREPLNTFIGIQQVW